MNLTDVAINVLLFFFVIDCVLLCLVVLMQRSKQEGLGAAFGGGITESMWGAQTSQVLVKTTVVLAAIFFLIAISLARLYAAKASSAAHVSASSVDQHLSQSVAPLETNAAPMVPAITPATNAAAPVQPTPATTPVTPPKK